MSGKKDIEISDISKAEGYIDKIYECMEKSTEQLLECLQENDSVQALKKIKFEEITKDPLNERPINFIEMLNQSFSDIVVLRGVEYLLNKYKGKTFIIKPGPLNGFDIESKGDKSIIAECFSVVSAFNNQKIKSDSDKLMTEGKDKDKYIFFYVQENEKDRISDFIMQYPEIKYMILNKKLIAFEELGNT